VRSGARGTLHRAALIDGKRTGLKTPGMEADATNGSTAMADAYPNVRRCENPMAWHLFRFQESRLSSAMADWKSCIRTFARGPRWTNALRAAYNRGQPPIY